MLGTPAVEKRVFLWESCVDEMFVWEWRAVDDFVLSSLLVTTKFVVFFFVEFGGVDSLRCVDCSNIVIWMKKSRHWKNFKIDKNLSESCICVPCTYLSGLDSSEISGMLFKLVVFLVVVEPTSGSRQMVFPVMRSTARFSDLSITLRSWIFCRIVNP